MAKVQTRRTISISREAHERAKEWADGKGQSLSSLIEAYIRRETGLPERETVQVKGRQELRPQQSPYPRAPRASVASVRRSTMADIAARAAALEERHERALNNPCRMEHCSRHGLHEAHA